MDKYREERALFIKALEEAICSRFDDVIANSPMTADCSEQHRARMAAMIEEANTAQAKRLSRAKLIAALIAAALLLTGCTLYVLRNKIKGFIENIYEAHICVEKEEEARKGYITDVYTLSYLPQGYVLTKEKINTAQVFYRWENSDGKQLTYIQSPEIGDFHIDVIDGYNLIIEYEGMDIYYRNSKRIYSYIWCDGGNYFSLVSYVELDIDELINIIDGMVIQK